MLSVGQKNRVKNLSTVDLHGIFCTNCTRGKGTPPVTKPKTIFAYQNNITVTVSRCPQEYIIILTKIVTHDVPTLMQDWCYMYLKLKYYI